MFLYEVELAVLRYPPDPGMYLTGTHRSLEPVSKLTLSFLGEETP